MTGWKGHIKTAVKVALGLGLAVLLATRIQWEDTPEQRGLLSILRGLSPEWTLAAAVLTFVPNLTIGLRWWVLMQARQLGVGSGTAVRLNLIGAFFNNVALGAGGGDLVKAYQVTAHAPGRRAEAITILFLDRFVGLMALCSVAVVFLPTVWDSPHARNAGVGVLGMLAVGTVGAMFFVSRRLRAAGWFDALLRRLPMADLIRRVDSTVHLYRHSAGAVGRALGLSWIGHLIGILGIWCAGRALGLDTGPAVYFSVVPVIWVMASVPLTPGAVGVMEAGYWWFHEPLGCNQEQAFALALVVRALMVLGGVPGALLTVLGGRRPAPAPGAEPAVEPSAPAGAPGVEPAKP